VRAGIRGWKRGRVSLPCFPPIPDRARFSVLEFAGGGPAACLTDLEGMFILSSFAPNSAFGLPPRNFAASASLLTVRLFRSNLLSNSLLICLLAIVALVLVLPQVDLPDAAFQSNNSPQALRAMTHQAPQSNVTFGSSHVSVRSGYFPASDGPVHEVSARSPQHVPTVDVTLRC
jgi:hypothetical protein